MPESTPVGFCFFLLYPDPDPESKIFEKPNPDPESLFHFGSSRNMCGHFLSRFSVKLSIYLCVLNCQTYQAKFSMHNSKLRCTHRTVCNLAG